MRVMRPGAATLVAVPAVAGAVTGVVATGTRDRFDDLAITLVIATYAVVALVIELARPGQRVGRLMLAGAAAWGIGEGLLSLGIAGLDGGNGSAYALLAVLGSASRGLGWLVLVLAVPLVFPDGRPPWTWAGRLVIGCIAAFTTATLLAPVPLEERLAEIDNPIGLPPSWQVVADLLAVGSLALAFVCLVLAVAGLVRRWRRGDELQRQQVAVFGVAFALPLLFLPVVATPLAEPWMFALVTLPVPVAIGVALLQRRLYDLQLAANRTLTYAALSVVLAGVYALVVGGVGVMLDDRGAAWLPWAGAGVVAVAFAPLRASLQGAANRLVYGRWSAPADVLADTGRRLADAADGPALLHALTEELVDGLGLASAEIRDATGRTLARSGGDVASTEPLPLTAYGATVGAVHWAGPPLRRPERSLLEDVAHQIGGAVHTVGLVEDLRAARESLVLAREQERRRIRRDLHDGLGPSLAALGLQVDAMTNLLASGQPIGDRLDTLQRGLRGTVAEVRRIVEGLRPPALDDLGLFGALAELGHELSGGTALELAVDLPGDAPALPAAVEAAAYRIAQEALTNVVRHAEASRCRVAGSVSSDALTLEVSDDGRGGAGAGRGVGMHTMQERAREIGGQVDVRSRDRGTSVTIRLPLHTGAPA
jgi:signal transduction histidine kinase